ncbi:MAG TPA: RNA polymerase sigma factor [Bacteroidota bacterium]|nr:RNA polymerase sigma factor [Bacteroidota bacterium]
MPLSDNEIVEKIRGGAKQSFTHLINRYKDKGMALAVRMLKDRQEAEEALQDAFVRAYNGLQRFEGKAAFGTWFYRILYNVCLTKLGKKNEEFQFVDYEDEREFEYDDARSTASFAVQFETHDLIEHIKTVMETLPKKYSTVLSLFYLQERSHEEICEVTQLPLGTVKTHLFRARAMLYERLQKEFQTEKVPL